MGKSRLPSQIQDYSQRYNQLVVQADLAQQSEVRWCMIIKPYGFAIRENIKQTLDSMFKHTWHSNAYFPLLIPKSYLSAEEDHIEWFAKECAVVTHYRLQSLPWWWVWVDPDAKLEEELVIRPTSETIIWKTYKQWIASYRDLPIKINQWANVMRWEMRTRLFLRTAEFLWQEWHTAHATKQEAIDEAALMLNVYNDFLQHWLCLSWIQWVKSPSETFAWAEYTLTIECMMKDKKALQSCTSHFLGQNFAKAFDVTFKNQENQDERVWATSWWLSTRILWSIIMSHGDDLWLVLPPAIAPLHCMIVPIAKSQTDLDEIHTYLQPLLEKLDRWSFDWSSTYHTASLPIQYTIDNDLNKSPWWKFAQAELQWVPLRLTVWSRDIAAWTVEIARRDISTKITVSLEEAYATIVTILHAMQQDLLEENKKLVETNTYRVDTREWFTQQIEHWFVLAHWDGTWETEQRIKELTKATIRCIPFDEPEEKWQCILTWKPSKKRVLFAKAY